jgi:predicted permease
MTNWLPKIFRRKLYNELAEEMREHLEEKTEQFVREGMPRKEAQQAARRAFGNANLLEERSREIWQWRWIENLWRDLGFSARLLSRSPGFAVVAILTLTLGVGANTAVFSLLNGLLLRPLPVPNAQQLILFRIQPDNWGYSFCAPVFRALESHHEIFSSVFAFSGREIQLRGPNGNENIAGALVSGQYFEALATRPHLGRVLTAADDRKGGNGYAVVISDQFWKTRFNRDPHVLGRKLLLANVAFTIVGVMPETFIGMDASSRPQVYVPLVTEPLIDAPYDNTANGYHSWWLRVAARLKPGASIAQANALMDSIAPPILKETVPDPNFSFGNVKRDGIHFVAEPGSAGFSYLRTRFREPLLLTFALCAAVLLLACINLASLLLARAAMRQREIATRLAIGATRRRLIQQLLVDSLLLALLGTAAGLAVAPLVSRGLVAMLVRSDSDLYLDASIDWRVFLFAALAAVLSTVLIGLLPALQATAGDLNRHMKDGARATSADRNRLLPKVLLAIEVALAMVLVAGAGLLGTSLIRLYQSGFGFDPNGLVLANLDMGKQSLDGPPLTRLYQDIAERLAHQPGVVSVSYASQPPLTNGSWSGDLRVPGGGDREVFESDAAPDYFRTMRIPLLLGREFSWADKPTDSTKIILNESAAKMFFPNGDAVGKQVQNMNGGKLETFEVIAVVGNTKYTALRDPSPPMAYRSVPQAVSKKPSYMVILRVSGPVTSVAASLRSVALGLAPDIPAPTLVSMDNEIDDSVAAERVMALLSLFFAASALLVTGIGLYGTLAYATARRTSEIGIRMALGAERTQVVGLVFRENAWIAGIGCAAGLLSAILASRAIATFLYGTSPHDPWVLTISLAVLSLIAAVASLIPAIRAASIDPMKALRSE